jgi:hypothetical protein
VVGYADDAQAAVTGRFDDFPGGLSQVAARGENGMDVEVGTERLERQRSVPLTPIS